MRRFDQFDGGRTGISALALLALLAAVACTPSAPAANGAQPAPATAPPQPVSGTPIKLGILADISASFAPQGAMAHIATDLAINRINAAGGINGRPLEAIYNDPKGDPTQAGQLATQLVQQDQVDVLMGATSSAECLAVQAQAAKLQTVYVANIGCGTDELTSKSCDKYTFRTAPNGRQINDPLAAYAVRTYGPRWAILYQDYAFGQAYFKTWDDALTRNGGSLVAKIAMPLGETNVTPYVTQIPTDGSIDGLLPPNAGTDAARVMSVIAQFGFAKQLGIVGVGNRENFGGVWPEALNGEVFAQPHPSEAVPGNALDQALASDFLALASKDEYKQFAGYLGGIEHTSISSQGYIVYTSVTALKQAMVASHYAGKTDTDKLIGAFETLTAPQSVDFPTGPFIMNKADHQGRLPLFVLKVNGQNEEIGEVVAPDQLPLIGSCKIA